MAPEVAVSQLQNPGPQRLEWLRHPMGRVAATSLLVLSGVAGVVWGAHTAEAQSGPAISMTPDCMPGPTDSRWGVAVVNGSGKNLRVNFNFIGPQGQFLEQIPLDVPANIPMTPGVPNMAYPAGGKYPEGAHVQAIITSATIPDGKGTPAEIPQGSFVSAPIICHIDALPTAPATPTPNASSMAPTPRSTPTIRSTPIPRRTTPVAITTSSSIKSPEATKTLTNVVPATTSTPAATPLVVSETATANAPTSTANDSGNKPNSGNHRSESSSASNTPGRVVEAGLMSLLTGGSLAGTVAFFVRKRRGDDRNKRSGPGAMGSGPLPA